MTIRYKKFWIMCAEKEMSKAELQCQTMVSEMCVAMRSDTGIRSSFSSAYPKLTSFSLPASERFIFSFMVPPMASEAWMPDFIFSFVRADFPGNFIFPFTPLFPYFLV